MSHQTLFVEIALNASTAVEIGDFAPHRCHEARIQHEGSNGSRYRLDDTDPTTTDGTEVIDEEVIIIRSPDIERMRVIGISGTEQLNVHFIHGD